MPLQSWKTTALAASVTAAAALMLRTKQRKTFGGASVLITGGSRGLGLELS